MPKLQAPRGTRDLLPPERAVFMHLETSARDLATRYGYQPIETPMFENATVYERGVGEVTDVVEKERVILREAALQEGKPEKIVDKMVEGRLRNYYAEKVLCEQPFVKDDKQTVAQIIGDASVVRFSQVEIG